MIYHLLATNPELRAEAVDLIVEARTFTAIYYPAPTYANPFLDDPDIRLADPRDAREAEQGRRDVQGRLVRDRKLSMLNGQTLIQRAHYRVAKEDVIAAREFKPHAARYDWPDVFIMEHGKDRRQTYTLDQHPRARHAIDWYREESLIEDLPDLSARAEPYLMSNGRNANIANCTWQTIRHTGGGLLNNIADDALARAGLTMAERKKAWARTAVHHTLRDLTLFGLVISASDTKGNPVFALAENVVQEL